MLGNCISKFRTRSRRCKNVDGVVERQEVILGWDQSALAKAVIILLGAGGANGEIAYGLTRKGYGWLHIFDGDCVGLTNLNRQFFFLRDYCKNKAICLAKRLQAHGFLGSVLVPHPVFSNEPDMDAIRPSLIVCSVDLQVPGTRLDVCRYGLRHKIPVVFLAVSADADNGYVFVQESGEGSPCWSCVFKPEVLSETIGDRCPGEVGACMDILKTMGGIALYSIDSIIMKRPRKWNFWRLSLQTGQFGGAVVPPRPSCPVCGGGTK